MKNLVITKTAKITFTADDWELFDEKGRDEAALALNTALEQAVNAPGANEAGAYLAMQPVCKQFSHLGAQDSEADRLIERVIEMILEE